MISNSDLVETKSKDKNILWDLFPQNRSYDYLVRLEVLDDALRLGGQENNLDIQNAPDLIGYSFSVFAEADDPTNRRSSGSPANSSPRGLSFGHRTYGISTISLRGDGQLSCPFNRCLTGRFECIG